MSSPDDLARQLAAQLGGANPGPMPKRIPMPEFSEPPAQPIGLRLRIDLVDTSPPKARKGVNPALAALARAAVRGR